MPITLTQADLAAGFRDLGLYVGCNVLVHSSLSSFGHVEGGADVVIDALLEVVGSAGTVIVPTLTGSEYLSAANPPVFDPATSACWTGRIPETFRQRPDAVRSFHPTHSVAAIGANAACLTQDHINSVTPCDDLSPYGKLPTLPDCYILLIGVTHLRSTTFHYVEEAVGVHYHLQPGFVRARIIIEGIELTRHLMIHAYGMARDFDIMEPLFIERNIQHISQIGDATVRLVDAKAMVDLTTRCLRADNTILCARSST
jgi:aminoglycoside 3-N-acetyltransferase